MTGASSAIRRVIYVADPMCSWCWGFAPEIEKLREILDNETSFSMLMGGLRDGAEWNEKMKEFLRSHWKAVHLRTGQPFSDVLLQQGRFDYNTEPSCRACVAMRMMDEALEYDAFKALQRAFYEEGRDITDDAVILSVIRGIGIDAAAFEKIFHSEEAAEATRSDRRKAFTYGANAFPSLVVIDREGHLSLIRGYRRFEELKAMLGI
jgi:putative protein-disulfide isomerase